MVTVVVVAFVACVFGIYLGYKVGRQVGFDAGVDFAVRHGHSDLDRQDLRATQED